MLKKKYNKKETVKMKQNFKHKKCKEEKIQKRQQKM